MTARWRQRLGEAWADDLRRLREGPREAGAWLVSLVVHLALLLLLGLAAPRDSQGVPSAGQFAGVFFADGRELAARGMHDLDLSDRGEYFLEPEAPAIAAVSSLQRGAPASVDDALPTAELAPHPLPQTSQSDADGGGTAAGGTGSSASSGAEAIAGSGLELPGMLGPENAASARRGELRGLGQDAQTSVFGVQGTGSTFVYVFDRSASMADFDGAPLRAAQEELISSLRQLHEVHRFQIVFYNDRPVVCRTRPGLPPQMLYGNDRDRATAAQFVRRIEGGGGTGHFEALMTALRMNPDVIFFLTDAGEPTLTPSELAAVARANRQRGASINAIEFGIGPSSGDDNFLVQLARQNGGMHGYIDVTTLPRTR